MKGSNSLPRFLLRKRAGCGVEPREKRYGAEPREKGYGAEPRGRKSRVRGRAPENNKSKKIRAFCPYFALFYLFLFARKAAFGKYCLVFKAYYFYFGFNICFFHFFSPKNQYSFADSP